MAAIFEQIVGSEAWPMFDLKVDGRIREYDVEPDDLMGAVRRARLDPKDVLVEDLTGYRKPLVR